MAVKVDISELKGFAQKLNRLSTGQRDTLFTECTNELASRLWRRIVKRTPVKSGALRRYWTAETVKKVGNVYSADISNNLVYSRYAEFGHRQTVGRYVPAIGKRLKKGFVEGKFMMSDSEKEMNTLAPKILEQRLNQRLKEVFN